MVRDSVSAGCRSETYVVRMWLECGGDAGTEAEDEWRGEVIRVQDERKAGFRRMTGIADAVARLRGIPIS